MGILFAEVRLFASRISSLRSILLHLVLLIAFGIWIPRMKGLDFLDTQVLAAYVCLGLIFAGPATAQSFTEEVPPSFQIAKARTFVGVLYGEIAALSLTGAGIATVFLSRRGHFVPQPDWENLARSAMFGLGTAGLVASIAAWATVQFSRRVAMICLRLVFFGLLVLFFYRGQRLSEAGLTGAGICLAVAGAFIAFMRRACQSSPSPIT